MRYGFLVFLCTALLELAQADPISIPANGAVGLCSTAPTSQASFNATCDPPGVHGIYLVPQAAYNKLTNASNSIDIEDIHFHKYRNFSCSHGHVTSCQQFTGNFSLPLNVTCVAFVNRHNQTLNGNLVVNFAQNSSVPTVTQLSASTGAMLKVGEPWVPLIVAAGVGLVSLL